MNKNLSLTCTEESSTPIYVLWGVIKSSKKGAIEPGSCVQPVTHKVACCANADVEQNGLKLTLIFQVTAVLLSHHES